MTGAGVGANPDAFLPALAANAMGIAEFAETSIEDWQNQMRGGVVTASQFLHTAIHSILDALIGFANQIPLIGPAIAAVIMGFEGTLDTLGQWSADLLTILGQPTGLGTGSPLVGALDDIPILGPIAVFVGQLIDAIVNALGYAGSGFGIGNVLTYLGDLNSIAGGVVSDVQNLIDGVVGGVGNAIGDLIGAVNTGIGNAADAIGDITDIITNAGEATASAVGTLLQGAATNAQGVIEAVNNAADGVVSGASQLLADAVTNLTNLFSGAPAFLQGLSGVFGQQATNDAYAAAAAAQAAAAAEQARIQSAFNAVFNVSPASAGNVNVTVDFSVIANQSGMSGIMLPGSGSGSGYMGVTSGEAKWQGGTGDDIEVYPTVTTSDYQIIDVTLGSLNDLFNTGPSIPVLLYIPFRVNSARTSFCYLALYCQSNVVYADLGAVVSGTVTTFATSAAGALSAIASGGKFRIYAGDPTSLSPYAMQVLYNGTPKITYTDSSHVSQIGSGQRYVGSRMRVFNAAKVPPGIRTVTYQDNPPPPSAYPFSGRPTADVDAKGRQYASSDCGRIDRDNGGAWENIYLGPKAWATQPPSSGWSTTTLGTSSAAADLDGRLITSVSASGDNIRAEYRNLAASSNYTAELYLEATGARAQQWISGIVLRESSTGRLIVFGLGYNTTTNVCIQVVRYTNQTTFSAAQLNQSITTMPPGVAPNWLRIRDDGTNRYFDYSINGVDWATAYSESRATFMTANQIGYGVNNVASGSNVYLRLRSITGI